MEKPLSLISRCNQSDLSSVFTCAPSRSLLSSPYVPAVQLQLALGYMACRLRGQILSLGSPCILDQCRSDRPDVP